ncbi:unnamed protein product [Peronospora belbahrii]|uniref:Uncharacterized protein n=1 Tax=Peronospora belbahrii TaxID=622444 RepID=A0AAU9KR33_9STRA|nr:unnamed protein product [Peronospora belbahrii]CAH0513720.1 unnamed protein product [Peronospora belbahrii]
MNKLRRVWDNAANAVFYKLKTNDNELIRAASNARDRAQQIAADAANTAKHRLQLNAKEVKDAAQYKMKDMQKIVSHKVEKVSTSAITKARGVGNTMLHNLRCNQDYATRQLKENAKILQRSASDTVINIKQRTQQNAIDAASASQERARSFVSKTVGKLKRTSSSTVEANHLRRSARRVRNKLLVLGFAGVFLYGFGSAMPFAMAKYAVERAKLAEVVAPTDDAAASAVKK